MRVLQLIDSLEPGGAERVAVNYANGLSHLLNKSYLCATREEGVLKHKIDDKVGYIFLSKKKVIDFKAIKKLSAFIKANKIDIIQAHSSSFFMATIIRILNKRVHVIWHDHYGNSEFLEQRNPRMLKTCSRYFSFIFCVNKNLENWSKTYLNTKNSTYIPNFAVQDNQAGKTILKGLDNKRVVCLANFRPQKDHITLLYAFKNVVEKYPDWTLHCVGKDFNDDYSESIKNTITALSLNNNVYLYQSKSDIGNILEQADIGVLSSISEGLPIALLEYGLSKLSVIVTDVGECGNVIKDAEFGVLVEPQNPEALQEGLISLIEDKAKRSATAIAFNQRVEENFSSNAILEKVINFYMEVK